jgi:hypothetical protein
MYYLVRRTDGRKVLSVHFDILTQDAHDIPQCNATYLCLSLCSCESGAAILLRFGSLLSCSRLPLRRLVFAYLFTPAMNLSA